MTHQTFTMIRGAGFLAAVVLGLWLERRARHAEAVPSWKINAGLWAADAVLVAAACGACACSASLWASAAGVGFLNAVRAPFSIAMVTTVLALDFVSYGWHRANHRIRFLWRFHRVHHSDPSFTVSTALRFHPGEILMSLPLRIAAIVAVGAPVAAVAAFEVVFTFANLIEHGNIDVPSGLERRWATIGITPALHRRHHSRDREDLDSNFGTVFAFWDRLLGTYRPSSSATAIDVGLDELSSPVSVLAALRLPFSRLKRGAPGADPAAALSSRR